MIKVNRIKNEIALGICLISVSLLIYFMDFRIYGNVPSIVKSLLEQLAFIPIYVFIVTVVLEEILSKREKKAMMNRLNMVVGVFYSELGTKLLKILFNFDESYEFFSNELIITEEWTSLDFFYKVNFIKGFNFIIDSNKDDLNAIKEFLYPNTEGISKMIINTNLAEHESFTELLLALAHLNEELVMRKDVRNLSKADFDHISADIKRVYILLITEWLGYMKHIKEEYPYLYALAIRMNPFDPKAKVEIE